MNITRIRQLLSALRHVSLRIIFLRVRREIRQWRLVQSADSASRLGVQAPDFNCIAKNLLSPDFMAFAEVTRSLTASVFSFDEKTDALVFTSSGDVAHVGDLDIVPWSNPNKIPASDVNRCFFMSFVEQATLLNGEPVADLIRLDRHVQQLARIATANDYRRLTIPWQPLPIARRLVNVVAGLAAILARDPSLAERLEVTRLIEHVALLRTILTEIREDDLGYNHLASEIFAQCVAAHLFKDARGLARHSAEFVMAMSRQVGCDGLQRERSATYQCHLLGHLDALIAGRFLPERSHDKIVELALAMRSALALMTHRDGGIAVFNDAAVGDGPAPSVLGAAGNFWKDGVYRLSAGGYARVEHGAFSVIFDAGACGADDNPGHAHADFLAIELDVGNQRLFVDPGVASYKMGPERDACRSAAAHNGPTFRGLEPIEFIGAFRIGRRGRGRLLNECETSVLTAIAPGVGGTHDGFDRYGGGVARWISLPNEDSILIVDIWDGVIERRACTTFLMNAHTWRIDKVDRGELVLRTADDVCVVCGAVLGQLRAEEGASFHLYGPKTTLPAIRIIVEPDELKERRRRVALSIRKLGHPTINRDFAEHLSYVLASTIWS